MIQISCPIDRQDLKNIVIAAFERSCGVGSARSVSYPELIEIAALNLQQYTKYSILVLVSPPEECSSSLMSILKTTTAKVIIFGEVPPSLGHFLNMQAHPISERVIASSFCEPAPAHKFSESAGYIRYIKGLRESDKVLPLRALRHYDYASEWNNLGFGAITTDGTIWSLSSCIDVMPKNILAYLMIQEEVLSAYCALWDYPQASLLWFNREVGPVDSYEWRLIEVYISQYRFNVLPALPVILEVPYGFECAVTMRLDCDEDVESARPLYQAYKALKIPFSLALHASILAESRHHQLPREVIQNGGSVLSHTLTHAPSWGGSKNAAFEEGLKSADIIECAIGYRPVYAVSPFHQTPRYARDALATAGYYGCVGGIISSDPDFSMARGGRPPYSNSDFIGHTQQCMLHGDCILDGEDPLKIYKQAFDLALMTKTLFGYLDHPFSSRYQYGWESEIYRIQVHEKFINYIKKNKSFIFLSECEGLDFIRFKSAIEFKQNGSEVKLLPTVKNHSGQEVGIEYGGHIYKLSQGCYGVNMLRLDV